MINLKPMALSRKSLAGPGFIILNVLRAMNIIGLLSVVTARVVMLVKTFIVSKFFFFDAASHVITATISMFLVASECSIFRTYFARNWPVLSPSHGFVTLGWAMVFLGVNTLGNMNKEATSQKSLGLAFWRIVVGSGIIVLVLGFLNMVASYVFRDSAQGITARQVRAKGAIATGNPEAQNGFYDPKGPPSIVTSFPSSSHLPSSSSFTSPTAKRTRMSFSPMKTFRAARASILPSYHSRAQDSHTHRAPYPTSPVRSPLSTRSGGSKKGKEASAPGSSSQRQIEISSPLNVNPQFAHLVKPNLAHHPSQKRGEGLGSGTPF